jgi:anti-sigma factor RsiW
MSCSKFDIKGYFLEELSEEERGEVQAHLPRCEGCRDELEQLQLTGAALMAVRDEEIPQRIAFVSDRVFEPNWWQRWWHSAPRLGFASAAILSLAILFHAVTQPAAQAPGLDTAAVEQMVEREVARRVDAAVVQAVNAVEQRSEAQTSELLRAAEDRFEIQRRADMLAVQESFDYLRKQVNVSYLASAKFGASQ